ncbi:MAG: hypothetical protein NT049_08485, partial [Planctomycetota bacterium]|nr:hypothetical protein [Planctomycetota bacterium]
YESPALPLSYGPNTLNIKHLRIFLPPEFSLGRPFGSAQPLTVSDFKQRLQDRIVAGFEPFGKLFFLHPAHPLFSFAEHPAFPA